MKKTLFITALALSATGAMAETKLDFTGDAFVRAYNIDGHNTGTSSTQAFSQFFRLNVDAKPDEHLAIKTGLVLSSDVWEGDSHKPVTYNNLYKYPAVITSTNGTAIGGINDNGSGNGTITHLDHAYLEYTSNGWITSIGRLQVTSPGNFLTSDDRRDRIQVVKIFPSYDVLAFVYDKRSAGPSMTTTRDDLDMYSVNYYGSFNIFKYAMQTGYWISKNFNAPVFITNSDVYSYGTLNLDNIKQITPQLSTTVLGVNADLYYTVLWGGSAYYKKDHHAAALKLSHDFEVAKVEYESVVTSHGGLVATGFDTLSTIVNNNPDHMQSQTALRTIGSGVGASAANEYTHMLRISKVFTSDFQASIGGGCGKFYIYSTAVSEKNTILDATAKYDISKHLALNAKVGKFLGDNKDHAESLTLNANF